MKRIKGSAALALAVCIMTTWFGGAVLAAEQAPYPVAVYCMTPEERDTLLVQADCIPVDGRIMVTPNNSSGSNGNICARFTADAANMAFVMTTAPGATDYNVQLYAVTYGEAVKISDYATVMIDNGVYFTGLTVGQDYYLKVSSSTLITAGSNAFYTMVVY